MKMYGADVPYAIQYHPSVKSEDIPKIDSKMRERIKRAIETRLAAAPQDYGEPLRKTLKGYWKMRVGDYRIVFKIRTKDIIVLGILHRKDVYGIGGVCVVGFTLLTLISNSLTPSPMVW